MRYDVHLEHSLLGRIIVKPSEFAHVIEHLTPASFNSPTNSALYSLLLDLDSHGTRITVGGVGSEAKRRGIELAAGDIEHMINEGTFNVVHTAELLENYRADRAFEGAVLEQGEILKRDDLSAAEKLDLAHARLAEVSLPADAGPLADFYRLDEYMAMDTTPPPWVIPGLLRHGWRCMVVASEGVGKSTLFRQIATAASQGIHPFSYARIPPVRTMLVDLENPDDVIRQTLGRMNSRAIQDAEDYDGDRWAIWRKPGGINLRTHSDRVQFKTRVLDGRPDLVCLGPLYKCYQSSPKDGGDEQGAREVQTFLDEMRTKHDFALLLEHHAPKAQGGHRELLPFGTSMWQRWVDMGIKAQADMPNMPPGSLVLGRFRGDRVQAHWPDRVDRGKPGAWLWEGCWNDPCASAPIGALPQTNGHRNGKHPIDVDGQGLVGF